MNCLKGQRIDNDDVVSNSLAGIQIACYSKSTCLPSLSTVRWEGRLERWGLGWAGVVKGNRKLER